MRKLLLLTWGIVLSALGANAQAIDQVILDFESPETSTTFQYFNNGPLADSLNQVIANPDPTGANTSDSVAEFVMTDAAGQFVGAFSNPNPDNPVNLLNLDPATGQITMNVWGSFAANVLFKLEQSTTGSGDWEQAVQMTSSGQWETLTFDPTQPSDNGSGVVAAGNSYNRIVVFFDFSNDTSTVEHLFYFDDITVEGILPPDSVDVTFSVDMNGVTDPFTTVYVSGTFNGFSGTASPLDDSDGDGVWTGTYGMEEGVLEYKFQADDYTVDEIFNGTEECTQRDASGNFVNRVAQITSDTTLAEVAFGSCYAAGEAATITVNLGFPADDSVSTDGVFIAGGSAFGAAPNEFRLTDDDGDGIYSITFERGIGFESFFTFTNGPCSDYSCKEDIAGQDCADPDNFNDRLFDSLTTDLVLNTCFGECTDVATGCATTNLRNLDQEIFSVKPTLVSRFAELTFQTAQPKQITVMNLAGQEVRRETTSAGSMNLDFEGLPNGMYLIRVQDGQRTAIRKILKQ